MARKMRTKKERLLLNWITAYRQQGPKATGILIDLPIDEMKLIMQDWALLNTRVQ
mgnify:CR=1 FL=1